MNERFYQSGNRLVTTQRKTGDENTYNVARGAFAVVSRSTHECTQNLEWVAQARKENLMRLRINPYEPLRHSMREDYNHHDNACREKGCGNPNQRQRHFTM